MGFFSGLFIYCSTGAEPRTLCVGKPSETETHAHPFHCMTLSHDLAKLHRLMMNQSWIPVYDPAPLASRVAQAMIFATRAYGS